MTVTWLDRALRGEAGHSIPPQGNKQDVDTVPFVAARETLTRQTKTLITSRLRWRGPYKDRRIRTGKLENIWISDRSGSTTLIHCVGERRWAVSATMLCAIYLGTQKHVGIVSGRAPGCKW